MNEEDLKELLEFVATDYGRGYLDGVVGGSFSTFENFKRSRVSSPLSSKLF